MGEICSPVPSLISTGTAEACGHPCNVVWGQWKNSTTLAHDWLERSASFLCDLSKQEPKDANVNVDIQYTTPISTSLEVTASPKPDEGKLGLVKPVVPAPVTLGPVREVFPGTAPVLTAQKPSTFAPTVPLPLSVSPPGDPDPLSYPDAPVEPDYELPPVPTLAELQVADAPEAPLTLSFEATLPADDLRAPANQWLYSEDPYTTTLLEQINQSYLHALQNSSTGLSALAEQTLYDRARDRSREESIRARAEAFDTFASRGFSLPPGALNGTVVRIDKESRNQEGEINREVFLDQSKRAFEYNQFILNNASNWEVALAGVSNSYNQRLYEAMRYGTELALNQFEADVSLYQARVQAYAAYSAAFKVQIEAQLVSLEYYKSELEATRIKGELRQQDIDLYNAQLESIRTIVQTYNVSTQAYSVQVQAEGQKLVNYRNEVEAYKAQVEAKSEENRAYGIQVDAELTKIRGYATEVDAYQSEVSAYQALINAQRAVTDSDLAINTQLLDRYRAQLQTYAEELDAEARRVQAESNSYDAQVKGYAADVDSRAAQVRLDESRFQVEATNSYNQAQLRLRQATANVDNMLKSLALLQDLNKSGADITASVGTSVYGAINTSASVSGSDTTSFVG